MSLCGRLAATVILVMATGFHTLLAGMLGLGISWAFIANASNSFLADLFQDRIRRVMALAPALWVVSCAIAGPAIGLWLDFAQGKQLGIWSIRVPYLVGCMLICVGLLFLWSVIGGGARGKGVNHQPVSVEETIMPTRGRNYDSPSWILLLGFSHGLMVPTLMAWVNPMIQEKFAGTAFQSAVVLGAIALGLGIGRLVLAFIPQQRDDLVILPITTFAGGVLLFLGLIAASYRLSLLALSSGSFLSSTTLPCTMSLVATRFRHIKERLYGYTQASIALAGLVGPALVGMLADHGVQVWEALCISPLAACVAAVTSLLWRSRPAPRRPPQGEQA
jgi:MFS family permease